MALSDERDDDMAFSAYVLHLGSMELLTALFSLFRLRTELQKLLANQAGRQSEQSKSSGFLRMQYSQILASLTVRDEVFMGESKLTILR